MLDLSDTLQVFAALALALGRGFIGLLVNARTARQIAENVVLWAGIGTFVGTMIGFALWAAVKLSGGIG